MVYVESVTNVIVVIGKKGTGDSAIRLVALSEAHQSHASWLADDFNLEIARYIFTEFNVHC